MLIVYEEYHFIYVVLQIVHNMFVQVIVLTFFIFKIMLEIHDY